MTLLEEVKELERTLQKDGYKSWSYPLLTVEKIIKLLETEQFNKHGVMQAEGSGGVKEAAVASEGQEEANTCADFCKCFSPNDCRKLDNCLLKFKYHRA